MSEVHMSQWAEDKDEGKGITFKVQGASMILTSRGPRTPQTSVGIVPNKLFL